MKKIILFISFLVTFVVGLSAQSSYPKDDISYFRSRGYKGNALYTNHYIVWQGVETSHGYMFNSHHYLGAGVGAFFLPLDKVPAFGRVFVEYNAYFREKASTPIAGVKAGFCHAMNYNNDCKFRNAAELEPSVGWSWTLQSGKGLLLGLSYPFYVTSKPNTTVSIYGMPKISFGIEF